ncbi:MAG TPA: hypothetical protein VIJ56_00410 [Acidimicrobiales bacterium]
MKFSFRQILASTAGAVIAAVVASTFGVKGTIVGVAIGSAAATMGTAFVAQSIERGHEAVKQVAVRVPESSTLLRKLGGTGVTGPTASSVDASSTPTEVVGQAQPGAQPGHEGDAETVEMASTASPVAETQRLEISAAADAPATERLVASTSPQRAAVARPALLRGFSLRAIAVSAVTVFVLALLVITAVELISGKPLSAIFGGADTGTTLKNLVNPPPAPATTSTSTTSTTSTSTSTSTSTPSSTTTTTSGGSATSTTVPPSGATTTTTPGASTTTTTAGAGGGVTTTTTSVPPSP